MKKLSPPFSINNCTFNGPIRSDKESEAILILANALLQNSTALRQLSASIKDAGCMVMINPEQKREEAKLP